VEWRAKNGREQSDEEKGWGVCTWASSPQSSARWRRRHAGITSSKLINGRTLPSACRLLRAVAAQPLKKRHWLGRRNIQDLLQSACDPLKFFVCSSGQQLEFAIA